MEKETIAGLSDGQLTGYLCGLIGVNLAKVINLLTKLVSMGSWRESKASTGSRNRLVRCRSKSTRAKLAASWIRVPFSSYFFS